MSKPKLTPYEFRKKYTKAPLKKYTTPLKRTPIKKKAYKIPVVSKKRAAQLRAYGPLAKQFKIDHPVCEIQLPGCTRHTTDVHHTIGKEGVKLLDVQYFKAACRHCHDKINEHSKMAIEEGHSMRRNGKIGNSD